MDSDLKTQLQLELRKKLEQSNRYKKFTEDFLNCKNNASRILCLLNLPEVHELFSVKENYEVKSKQGAEVLRYEGNKCFQLQDYNKAVDLYTRSILKAPEESENLPLAFSNRSLANFHRKKYVLSMKDARLAIAHKFPEESQYKLLQRIGKCMYYLRNKDEAVKAFHQTIASLNTSNLTPESKQRIEEEVKTFIMKCAAINSAPSEITFQNVNCFHTGIPPLVCNPSVEIPCLADIVELKLDSYGGRSLFAKRDIEIGEVLVQETPFSSVLLKKFNFTHCHYCCNRVALAIPCKSCAGVIFCSEHCRDTAWKVFHWAECAILDNIQDRSPGDLGMLATRMIITAGVDKLLELEEVSDVESVACKAGFDESGVYDSAKYISAFSLVNHADKRCMEDLLSRTISAIFFLKHLEFIGFFSEGNRRGTNQNNGNSMQMDKSEECSMDVAISDQALLKQKCCVGAHILKNIMMLPCNAHEVSELAFNRENPAMSLTTELGAAIYPVLSLINHSCDPSVVRHSFGNVCVARAIRSIPAGTELKDNYGALYPTMDLAARQQELASQYFFNCLCEACVDDWPQYFDIPSELPIFRCSKCNGRVSIPPGNLTEFAKCSTCQFREDITLTLLQMGEMEEGYKQALSAAIEGNNSLQNMSLLLEYLRFVEGKVHRPWRDINDCQEALKQCLNMNANCYPRPV